MHDSIAQSDLIHIQNTIALFEAPGGGAQDCRKDCRSNGSPGPAPRPPRTGRRQSRCPHKRFSRWCHAGIWEKVFASLVADRDNQYLMLDSTIVRAHQHATSGKGGQGLGAGAFPRWTDHQDPHARRHTRPASALHRHRRSDWGRHHRASLARRLVRGRRARR